MQIIAAFALPVDQSSLDRYETDRASHRKLDPALKPVDLRLQGWAPWAKPHYAGLGWPSMAIHQKLLEGGILARSGGHPHPPEWPAEVAEVDKHVAALPTRHIAATMAHYFHLALTAEQRAARYAELARYLARTRPRRVREDLGPASFRADLDRARWTLKALLRL